MSTADTFVAALTLALSQRERGWTGWLLPYQETAKPRLAGAAGRGFLVWIDK